MKAIGGSIGAIILVVGAGILYLLLGIKYKKSKKIKGRVIESKDSKSYILESIRVKYMKHTTSDIFIITKFL